ncbi:MAG: hypothetical protein ACI9YL_000589 [Luteibaculaceae bacterium]|jgi:hypothetical protein
MNFKETFSGFSDNSRVWVYTPSRVLSDGEKGMALEELKGFTQQWSAHGSALKADACVFGPGILVLVVDEDNAGATGCSIDASAKVIQDLGSRFNVDFFNRIRVWAKAENGEWAKYGMSDANMLSDKIIFNSTVLTLGNLKENGLILGKESWLAIHMA